MQIRLTDIDAGNWHEAIKLELAPGQEHFVASNIYSLAEAFVKPEWAVYRPLAVYHDVEMVGFAMYAGDPASAKNHYVQRLMIDQRFQGRGYGRAAMIELLKLIRENECCEEVTLTVNPDNTNAQNLYRSLGFEDTGKLHLGELVYTLRLNRAHGVGD
ncbi:MAG: GNAT family N-acetyltransferase [Acidobacteria bacterium]|nr:GNAT family N-acetyltransferase [Acidobacteriota bacterium]